MILVAGLTPAWQQIVRFDEFHDGERTHAFFEMLKLYDRQG